MAAGCLNPVFGGGVGGGQTDERVVLFILLSEGPSFRLRSRPRGDEDTMTRND